MIFDRQSTIKYHHIYPSINNQFKKNNQWIEKSNSKSENKKIYLLTEPAVNTFGHVNIVSSCPSSSIRSLLSFNSYGLIRLKSKKY